MRSPFRPLMGALSGLVWGLGVAVLVQMYGIRPLDPLLLYGLPVAAALLSAAWVAFRRRGGAAAGIALLLFFDPASVLAQPRPDDPATASGAPRPDDPAPVLQGGDCAVRLEFPDGRRAVLQESSRGDPIVLDLERDAGLVVLLAGPESFAGRRPVLWIEIGGRRIELMEPSSGLAADTARWVVSREEVERGPRVPPGIYHVGGGVEGVCDGDGYIHLPGNPLGHPAGLAAVAAVFLGLLGTWLAGRPPPAGRPRTGVDRSLDQKMIQVIDRAPAAGVPPLDRISQHLKRMLTAALPALDRTIQARLFDEAGRPLGGFLPGATHTIRVSFDPPAGSEAAVAEPVELGIVLTEPDLLYAPLTARIGMDGTGEAAACAFPLTTLPDTERVDARLIVHHGNRVLQTARLPSAVHPAGRSTRTEPTDVARPETVVRGSAAGLARRRAFDAAFVVNHDAAGRARATGIRGDDARTIDLEEKTIREAVAKISKRLGEIAQDPAEFAGLDSAGAVSLLRFLGHHGRLMRNAVVHDFLGPELAGARYLQIVSAKPDGYLPLEFAYDYPAPGEDAALCPDALAALAGPGFPATCPRTDHAGLVCPFGFWGLSRVIERQAYQPTDELTSGFLIRGHPTAERDRIPIDGGTLLAASGRVDAHAAGTVDALRDDLARATGERLEKVASWEDWTGRVESGRPAVLLLLPHTVYSNELETFGLEIDAADRVWVGEIDQRYLPPEDRPVVVALLGCETAAAGEVGYERFPGLFRRAGAEIVVGTLTEVLGRHAAPVGRRLVELLYAHGKTERTFGELMVELRRRHLAEGELMVLALVAYGDADWILTGEL